MGLFALEGSEYISDTTEHIGNYYGFHAFAETELDHITSTNLSGNTTSGLVIAAGDDLYCQFHAIQLASGRGMAYKLSRDLPSGIFTASYAAGQFSFMFGANTFTWPVAGAAISDAAYDASALTIAVVNGIATLSGGSLNHTFPVAGDASGLPGPFIPQFAAGIATFQLENSTKTFTFPVS